MSGTVETTVEEAINSMNVRLLKAEGKALALEMFTSSLLFHLVNLNMLPDELFRQLSVVNAEAIRKYNTPERDEPSRIHIDAVADTFEALYKTDAKPTFSVILGGKD